MLAIYVVMDGYDFGAGIIHLFFAKKEADKQKITRAIGPFWDANEVWIIAAGGVLFFAFPTLYASSFSGFYLPLIMILWLLIFRALGLELRGQFNYEMWHSIWDVAFGIASFLLALFFGIALGNIVRGVNFGNVVNGISTHEAHYFFLPLWNPEFSPLSERLGIIDWFTVLTGIISVITLSIHGANWIIFKTNSSINNKLKNYIFYANILLLGLTIFTLIIWHIVVPHPMKNFYANPVLFVFPLLVFAGSGGLFFIRKLKDGMGFVFSTIFILGGLASTAVSLFPNFLPSTNNVNPSLTVQNSAAHEYGLSVGMGWISIAVILVIAYVTIQYRVFKGKMDDVAYGEH